ncbi:nucleotide exchange factor GrpE [Frankia sp. CcI156]|uniref:Protein GrpE n=1 Tax=Frankia casuarinae (strain DSM 45818 / CECT 9043 / HFP020203 / CcI3) TaxID=106370 RepID=Q2J4U3_FRACC|nr:MULTISPECIES: nucleotide exchange factor GrpE [Frankia]ABD13699.1 GrpE protein [Frankia casuarinae]ETA02715.1 molecular chaperone GrpE (heat shock protein) [Frankia sp. CcI6]EYT93101.1 molecular chaperone GrpE (heat shock protein) [Frankia casuarinae]KDA43191.1 molecular chaperone GrpE (heat shock protein) [Frankia sp. BMG5.23]KEZ37911.1 molecular chaperone GrpE (heat shock protein) [Frankia sp. CeD]
MTSGQAADWWGSSRPDGRDEAEEPPVVVRDRRRIDPESGEVRPEAAAPPGPTATEVPPAGVPAGEGDGELVASLRQQVTERTADLQRLKAEFDNYRRRVERDRQQIGEQATAKLLASLLSTLDDIGRARDHGDLEGPFKAIAEALEAALEATGLERYGAKGDEFDPSVHEALMHSYRSDVSGPTCVDVFRAGYLHAGKVLRPAQVSVAEPSGEVDEIVDQPVEAEVVAGAGEVPGSGPGQAGGPPDRPTSVPDDTGSVPGPDNGGPTVSAG